MLRIIYGPYPCRNGESGGDPRAFNAGNYGGLQINYASHRDKLIRVTGSDDPALLYDPAINVAVAHLVYEAAGGTSPWRCA